MGCSEEGTLKGPAHERQSPSAREELGAVPNHGAVMVQDRLRLTNSYADELMSTALQFRLSVGYRHTAESPVSDLRGNLP